MPALRHHLHLLAYTWRAVGPAAMLLHSIGWAADADAREIDRGFDDRHGTDTTTALTPVEANIPPARRRDATMYLPTAEHDLEAMLTLLPWPRALIAHASFVDLGSGKGRVVLLAAERRWREVVGVELSPVLHEIARRNLAIRGTLASPVRLVHGDALGFEPPSGPLVVYLYHPFREAIAAQVIDRLCASLAARPRPAAIVYGHPTVQAPYEPSVFARGGVFASDARGGRSTRRFEIGWSIWTNRAWLASR
jgi:SAM-dependent methyltransferase